MKVNFDTVLMGLKGQPIKVSEAPDSEDCTLGFVSALALQQHSQDDLLKKLKVFKLLKAIVESEGKGEIEITTEDVVLLKEKIGAPGFNNPVVCGRCVELLER